MAEPKAPAACGTLSLEEYLLACCNGRMPRSVVETLKRGGQAAEMLCVAELLGVLEPVCATRPGVCDPVSVFDRDVSVEPAALNADGSVTPSARKALAFCAPLNKALVVAKLRLAPANRTAAEQGEAFFKNVNLGGFGQWCLPFEPDKGPGNFANVEHIVVPPRGGFALFAQNSNAFSEALFHVHAEAWACC